MRGWIYSLAISIVRITPLPLLFHVCFLVFSTIQFALLLAFVMLLLVPLLAYAIARFVLLLAYAGLHFVPVLASLWLLVATIRCGVFLQCDDCQRNVGLKWFAIRIASVFRSVGPVLTSTERLVDPFQVCDETLRMREVWMEMEGWEGRVGGGVESVKVVCEGVG